MYQSHQRHVAGQLVGDARGTGRQLCQFPAIVPADAADTLGVQLREPGRDLIIAACRSQLRPQAARQQLQFAGAVHLRMAGQYLLHQCGAGSGHADDEYRQFTPGFCRLEF